MSTVSPPTPAFRLLIRPSRRNLIIALSLSLAFAIIYGILALQQAFGGEYVVQDDARQHIFWMQRYLDPGAFPNDLIADYFQSAAPLGYDLLYRTLARLGLEPHLVARVLPFFFGAHCRRLWVFFSVLRYFRCPWRHSSPQPFSIKACGVRMKSLLVRLGPFYIRCF